MSLSRASSKWSSSGSGAAVSTQAANTIRTRMSSAVSSLVLASVSQPTTSSLYLPRKGNRPPSVQTRAAVAPAVNPHAMPAQLLASARETRAPGTRCRTWRDGRRVCRGSSPPGRIATGVSHVVGVVSTLPALRRPPPSIKPPHQRRDLSASVPSRK